MNLAVALEVAGIFKSGFGQYFSRLEVAGSVRRQKSEVKDLELVGVVPAGNREPLVQALDRENRLQCLKPGTPERLPWPIKRDGKYWKFAYGEQVRFGPQTGEARIDLFLAQPDNWGLIYLIRTGPDVFGQFCLARWKTVSKGGYSKEGYLNTSNGVRLHTPEEADIFRALHLAFIEPENREKAMAFPEVSR